MGSDNLYILCVLESLQWNCYITQGFILYYSDGKESTCNLEDLGSKDPLEEGMATHSSILA